MSFIGFITGLFYIKQGDSDSRTYLITTSLAETLIGLCAHELQPLAENLLLCDNWFGDGFGFTCVFLQGMGSGMGSGKVYMCFLRLRSFAAFVAIWPKQGDWWRNLAIEPKLHNVQHHG